MLKNKKIITSLTNLVAEWCHLIVTHGSDRKDRMINLVFME